MPLEKGSSRATVSRNISEMVKAGHPRSQAIAASLRQARQAKEGGGKTMTQRNRKGHRGGRKHGRKAR